MINEIIINERIKIINITTGCPCDKDLTARLIYENDKIHKNLGLIYDMKRKQMINCENGWYITKKESFNIWKTIEEKLSQECEYCT